MLRMAALALDMFESGRTFLEMSRLLNQLSMRRHLKLWLLKPKFHMFFEQLCRLKRWRMNARFTHGFVDEDSMWWLRQVGEKVHPRTFELSVLKRGAYRMQASQLRWARIERKRARLQ